MRIELAVVERAEAPVLANLMDLYIHDFSEVLGGAPGPDGRFRYERLPLYFEEAGRTPLFIRAEGELAGFALVSRGSVVDAAADVWDLAEFFVVRGLRRRGVGALAASAVFDRFGGSWEVRALDRNVGACEFWRRAIARHTRGDFDEQSWVSESGAGWKVFRFAGAPA